MLFNGCCYAIDPLLPWFKRSSRVGKKSHVIQFTDFSGLGLTWGENERCGDSGTIWQISNTFLCFIENVM